MGIETISAVSDSGPLIHLSEINCLSILSIFKGLHVPDAVWIETVVKERISERDMLNLANIHRHSLSSAEVMQYIEKNNLVGLHFGEKECMCLCQKMNISVLLTDDLAVRNAARCVHLIPVGSLGIVVKSYSMGRISQSNAERYIIDLYEVSSLFVTRTIVELAIEQLRNHVKSRQNIV